MNKSDKIKLPQEIFTKLYDLLSDIENIIGHACQININQLDHYNFLHSPIITTEDLDPTLLLEIYDTIDEYKELEGITIEGCTTNHYYNTALLENMFKKKYNEERFSSILTIIDKNAGVCNKCNKYEATVYEYNLSCYRINNSDDSSYDRYYSNCISCGVSWSNCKYHSITVNGNNLTISNNKKEIIAKFRLIRQKFLKSCDDNSLTNVCDINNFSIII